MTTMSQDNIFKILVATDNHVGYMEKDPVRFNDSLESLEEILKIAKDKNVDFILLGGDLFHDNKPSRQVLHRTLELLRHYCMGSRPCPIQLLSDPAINFKHSKFPVVNYEDPHYNVAMPVFIIHGNHDDPTGDGNLSVMDILSVTNLVNYFGKVTDIENIEVTPILLKKGKSKLALYGLGSCRDERLHRLFRKGKVKFLKPIESEGDWFNILVLHQNRAKHGATNYIPPSFIPGFFDLVIWGHEHECLIEPEFVLTGETGEDGEEKGVFISQPGSSVATSLSDGELAAKHVGLMSIKDDCTFKIDPVRLTSVRPFILEAVELKDTGIHFSDEAAVFSYLTEKVKSMVEKVRFENGSTSKKPLVRLKVDYNGGYSSFSLARFGQQFQESVANPSNILLWFRQRNSTRLSKKKTVEDDFASDLERFQSSDLQVATLVEEELKKELVNIMSEKTVVDALTDFVEKEENEALTDCAKFCLDESQTLLKSLPPSSKDISDIIKEKRDELHQIQESKAAESMYHSRSVRRSNLPDSFADDDPNDSDDSSTAIPVTSERSRGRSSRGGGSRRRGPNVNSTERPATAKTSGGRGAKGRGSRGARGGTNSSKGRGPKSVTKAASAATRSPLTFKSMDTSTSRNDKRPIVYKSDSDGEDLGQPAKKRRPGGSGITDSIDLTQSDESEHDVELMTGRSQDSSNPFSACCRMKR